MADNTERLVRAFKDLHFRAEKEAVNLEFPPKLPPLAQDLENTWEALRKAQVKKDHKSICLHITKLGGTLLEHWFRITTEWARSSGRNVGDLPTNGERIDIGAYRLVGVSSGENWNDQGLLLIEMFDAKEKLEVRASFGPNVGEHNKIEELEMEYGLDDDETGICLKYKIKFDGVRVSTIERQVYTAFEGENIPSVVSTSQIDCSHMARYLNNRKSG